MRLIILIAGLIGLSSHPAFVAGQGTNIQNTIGVVTLADNGPEPDSVRLYDVNGKVWHVFTFFDNDTRPSPTDFSPLGFKPDYYLFQLAATRRTRDGWDVIVNQETGLTKHLRNAPFLKLISWEQYVLSAFAVEFDSIQNPIRIQPRDAASVMIRNRQPRYVPAAIEGDWLRVTWGENPGEGGTGWIRWRSGARIVIEVFYLD